MQPLVENTANTPAFLGKLRKMVNDPATDHQICWSPSGTSFVIRNQGDFWYKLLPLYYKHNNMSSFVRQLNMYGFHKMSTVENGSLESDKDEIQFSHPFFIRDKPELMRNIKRKATTSKSSNENNSRHDELNKVLSDMKQLRGRQASVDSQLNAMKQENGLLWREVAILRQKHIKQQKIVNKLIQFLVTLVHPSRMTVGTKRGYHLMLNESPTKKRKVSTSSKDSSHAEGPTIHELDTDLEFSPKLYDEEETAVIDSPATSAASETTEVNSPSASQLLLDENGASKWDKPQFVEVQYLPDDLNITPDLNAENLDVGAFETEPIASSTEDNSTTINNDKVFLNPSAQDTLLSNLMKNNFSDKQEETGKGDETTYETSSNGNKMALATRDTSLGDIIRSLPSTSDAYGSDLNNHIEATQNELDQLKDILNGYNSFVDANALLGDLNKMQTFPDAPLFTEDSPPSYDLNVNEMKSENLIDSADPLVSGSELAPYGNTFDFTELLDDSVDGDNSVVIPTSDPVTSTINTPQVDIDEPIFPPVQNPK